MRNEGTGICRSLSVFSGSGRPDSFGNALGKKSWIDDFPRLEDVRGMTEKSLRNAEVPLAMQSGVEGTHVLSWIWTSLGAGAQIMSMGDEGLHDGTRSLIQL